MWNVKTEKDKDKNVFIFGFNRYIVECKVATGIEGKAKGADLIDTLWNVKAFLPTVLTKEFNDLIDTLWNVKVCFKKKEWRKNLQI